MDYNAIILNKPLVITGSHIPHIHKKFYNTTSGYKKKELEHVDLAAASSKTQHEATENIVTTYRQSAN